MKQFSHPKLASLNRNDDSLLIGCLGIGVLGWSNRLAMVVLIDLLTWNDPRRWLMLRVFEMILVDISKGSSFEFD